jgi:hypothetical protein
MQGAVSGLAKRAQALSNITKGAFKDPNKKIILINIISIVDVGGASSGSRTKPGEHWQALQVASLMIHHRQLTFLVAFRVLSRLSSCTPRCLS